MPCLSWPEARDCLLRTRPPACAGTGPSSLRQNGRGKGFLCRERSAFPGIPVSRQRQGRRHTPCLFRLAERRNHRVDQNNQRRRRGSRPSPSPASARPPGWTRRIPSLPGWGWCRRNAGGRRHRIRRPARNSGKSTWRDRCEDSRWVPAETG